jgi:5-methyltetrahydropteroyltriglutamate--homocysteine methyltransferase
MESRSFNKIQYPNLTEEDFTKRAQFVPDNPVVTSKIKLKKRIAAEEVAFMKRHSPGRFKVTMPSPIMLRRAIEPGNVSKQVYPEWNDFVEDYTGALAQEIKSIVDDGVTYLQLDAPGYIQFFVPDRRARLKEFGITNAEEEFKLIVDADNKCLRAARKPGVTIGVHICLGTYILGVQGPLGGAGGDYDGEVLGRIVDALDADRFLIEYSDRSGALDSLKMIPKNKTIVLGLLNIRDPRVESVEEIMKKAEAASKYIPMENLALSPNCGFSGASAGAFVTEDIQRRKLENVVEASRRLWNS